MTPCNNRVFLSKLLKFTIGTDCEEVIIHSDILKSHSTPWFDSDGGSFAGDESIIIKDTDKHIFSLACQYLYTGDYSITIPGDTPPPGLTFGGREKVEQARVLEGCLFRDTETVEQFADYLVRRIQPRPSEGSQGSYSPTMDYTEMLLTHARLHVFAAKYGLEELRDICLFKMLHLLRTFPICQDRTGDIVRLFDFALRAGTERCENLIRMVCHYAAWHIRLFLHNREFEILLQEQPTLVKVLLTIMSGSP
ncbi:hypothetical protein BDV33DRAFT_109893 [Aspergillus novoparasiticus]|uniref:BTB domain-containing protein n=1 Tax=Aspergillus novoparasiticus TaxID=986946 RepID=A0A5N6E6A7_9EURO|nr:hypothetical protein BDV33DRAFT_109893 [Aspergillus novoparasiticus]